MPHLVILYTANLDRPVAEGGSDLGDRKSTRLNSSH